MKKVLFLVLATLMLVSGSTYSRNAGSALGTLTTARAIGQGTGNLGFGIGVGDGTSFVGSFALGLSDYSDGRIRIALFDSDTWDDDIRAVLGVDYKWQMWSFGPESDHPFDFSVGGMAEFADFGGASVFQIGGFLLGSYPITFENGMGIAPYGRLNARVESVRRDRADDSSDLGVGLNMGVMWNMTSTLDLYGEIQLDGSERVFLGIDFNVM